MGGKRPGTVPKLFINRLQKVHSLFIDFLLGRWYNKGTKEREVTKMFEVYEERNRKKPRAESKRGN